MAITFENLPQSYQKLPTPVFLLRGRSSGGNNGLIAVFNDKFPVQYYEVNNGLFKLYLHLGRGVNNLLVQHIDGRMNNGYPDIPQSPQLYGQENVSINYEPFEDPNLVPKIHLCLILGKDSKGNFDIPGYKSKEGNSLELAIKKMRTAGRIMQLFTQDDMFAHGLGIRSFQFVEETCPSSISSQDESQNISREQIKIHIIRSEKTVAEIRDPDLAQQNSKAKNGGGLFGVALEALKNYGGPFSDESTKKVRAIAACIFLDGHYDVPKKLIVGHAALGGGTDRIALAINGSHGMHSWPSNFESIYSAFTDCTKLSDREVGNDCGQCSSSWECLTVTLGAFLHEIGHSLGCPHQEHGVMLRDYITMDRKFLTKEKYCIRTNKGEWSPVLMKDEPGWHRLDELRFLYHPAFALQTDYQDNLFRPMSIRQNQGMRCEGADNSPVFYTIDSDTLQVRCETGIYLVECHVGEWSRVHYEYLPQVHGGPGPQKTVTLKYSVLQQQLADNFKNKPVKVEVLTVGFGNRNVGNLGEYLMNNSKGVTLRTQKGETVSAKKGDMFGSDGKRKIDCILENQQIQFIRTTSAMALDGIEIHYDNGSVSNFGNTKNHYKDFYLQPGEFIVGIVVRSGLWVDGIQYVLNSGRVSDFYGKQDGGSKHSYSVPNGSRVVGFHGGMADWIYGVGIYYV